MIFVQIENSRPKALTPVFIPTSILLAAFVLILSASTFDAFAQSGNSNSFQVGFEGNTSVYRWANGYRELLIPSFNTTREARRSVVSGGLFSIISFDNVPCNSDSMQVGTCYSNRECTNLGGTSSGICAGSFGTCCVVQQTCGGTVTTNNTYFTNPGYPSTTSGPLTCSLTINNLDGATQLYLELLDFNIRGPSSGACMNDSFTVTTSDSMSTFPILCGSNVGQMIYLPIGTGPSTLTFNLASGSDPRSWNIRIVQFKPNDSCSAPAGCNQWYQDPSGVFDSFNFASGMGELLNNYCINACFQVKAPNCGVLLTEGSFMLPGMAPNDCPDGSYLLINNQKYCGDTLNNGMLMVNTSMSGYAQVQVCSGKQNADMDLGFNLTYSPLPCSVTTG